MAARRTSDVNQTERPLVDRLRDGTLWKTLNAIKEANDIGAALVSMVLIGAAVVASARPFLKDAKRGFLAGVVPAVLSFVAAISVSFAWYKYRQNEEKKKKWKLVGDLNQRDFLNYKSYNQTVIFGRKGEVTAWLVEVEIEYNGDRELEAVSNYAWYDGEQSGMQAVPANINGVRDYITIEDELLGRDGSYNFIIRFHPALKPHDRRHYKYRVKLSEAQRMAHPYVAIGRRVENGYGKSVFSVQFHEAMLPAQGKVRQVYWPCGIGKDSGGWREIAMFEVDKNNNEVDVSFNTKNTQGLEGDPGRRRYGLVWEWPGSYNKKL